MNTDTPKTDEVLNRLRSIVADLNDTSTECLSALDSIKIIELERDLAAARAKAEQLEAEKESAYDKGFEAGIKEDRSDPGITDFERI